MDDVNIEPARAAILQFPKKRGRPQKIRPMNDTGTPELIIKRMKQETAEALDLCLERGLITDEQHWCGIHLRWLYTLRYGAPGVRAVDPTHFGGKEIKLDDPEWRAAREAEYAEAMQQLNKSGHALMLMNLCIYNERPTFLKPNLRITKKQVEENICTMDIIRRGLDILAACWRR